MTDADDCYIVEFLFIWLFWGQNKTWAAFPLELLEGCVGHKWQPTQQLAVGDTGCVGGDKESTTESETTKYTIDRKQHLLSIITCFKIYCVNKIQTCFTKNSDKITNKQNQAWQAILSNLLKVYQVKKHFGIWGREG